VHILYILKGVNYDAIQAKNEKGVRLVALSPTGRLWFQTREWDWCRRHFEGKAPGLIGSYSRALYRVRHTRGGRTL